MTNVGGNGGVFVNGDELCLMMLNVLQIHPAASSAQTQQGEEMLWLVTHLSLHPSISFTAQTSDSTLVEKAATLTTRVSLH